MEDNFITKYDKLDVNTKRNQLSDELIIINELIKNVEGKYGITSVSKVKNYDQVGDAHLTEGEMLTFFYEDVFNIQQELITLLSAIDKL